MPHAVTHVLIAIVVASLIRELFVKEKKSFPIKYILIAGIAGLLPDLDVIAYWVLYWFGFTLQEVHRTFLHSLFIPLIFLVLAIVVGSRARIKIEDKLLRWKYIFLMIFLGVMIHLVLDATLAGKIMPFYPLSNYSVGLDLIRYLPVPLANLAMPTLDAIILVLWLIWIDWRSGISRFV